MIKSSAFLFYLFFRPLRESDVLPQNKDFSFDTEFVEFNFL